MIPITNTSGKFIMQPQASHYAAEEPVDNSSSTAKKVLPKADIVDIPPCPAYKPSPMEMVRHYFGSLWWLWLVVLVFYLSKEVD